MNNHVKIFGVAMAMAIVAVCLVATVSVQSDAWELRDSDTFNTDYKWEYYVQVIDEEEIGKLVFTYTGTSEERPHITSKGDSETDTCTAKWTDYISTVTTVELDGLDQLGDYMLAGFTKLTTVTNVSETPITDIGAYALHGCTSLRETNIITSSLQTVGGSAFYSTDICGNLDLSGVTTIGKYAFAGTEVASVTFGTGLTYIDNAAFSDCYALSGVKFVTDEPPTLGRDVFVDSEPAFDVPNADNYRDDLAATLSEGTSPSINDPVCQVGTTQYVCLDLAIAAVPTNDDQTTITMFDNYKMPSLGQSFISQGQNIILNLGGHTIAGSPENDKYMFWNSGTLTINGTGSLTSSQGGVLGNEGELSVSNVTISANYYTIDNWNDGVLNLTNCIVNSTRGSTSAIFTEGTATVTGSTLNGTNGAGGIETQGGYTKLDGCTFTQEGSGALAYYAMTVAVTTDGEVDVYNCEFDVPNYGFYVYNSGGTINIHSGTYVAEEGGTLLQLQLDTESNPGSVSVINITGGSFTGDVPDSLSTECYINITGGSFTDTGAEKYIPPGYSLFYDSETQAYTAREVELEDSVASVTTKEDGTLYFRTIDAALEYVPDGGTVVITHSFETTGFTVSKGITIDLAGNDIDIVSGTSATYALYFTSGDSSIIDSIGTGSITDIRAENGGTSVYRLIAVSGEGNSLTLSVAISGYKPTSGFNYLVVVRDSAALVLDGAVLSQETSDSNGYLVGVTIYGPGSTSESPSTELTVKGDTSIVVKGYGIVGNGSTGDDDAGKTVINIESGRVESTGSTAIYHPQVGVLNVTGGTIIGPGAIEMRAGTLNVSGDAHVESNNSSFATDSSPGEGNSVYGAAIAVSQHSYNPQIQVNISGGTFVGCYAFYENDLFNDGDTDDIAANITGGTFIVTSTDSSSVSSENMTKFISGGTFLKQNSDGTTSPDTSLNNQGVNSLLADGLEVKDSGSIGFSDPTRIVQVYLNGTPYESINQAITDAQDGYTITLNMNINEYITIPVGKSIILDLNGYSLKNSATTQTLSDSDRHNTITVEEGAELTIEDSSEAGTGTVDNVSHGMAAVLNYGTFTLKSGTLTRSVDVYVGVDDIDNNTFYVFKNQGTAYIEGGAVEGTSAHSSLIGNAIDSDDADGATLTISGGTITQRPMNAVKNDEYGGTLYITGGVITSDDQAVQNWDTAVISGGRMEGDVSTWNYSGSTGKADTTISDDAVINGDVYAAKYTDSSTGLSSIADPSVEIEGGSITGELRAAYGFYSTTLVDTVPEGNEQYAWLTVSGGTFTNRVEDRFIAPDSALTGGEGAYGVENGYLVKFNIVPGTAQVTITNNDGTEFIVAGNGNITLANGKYGFIAIAPGYDDYEGSFTVSGTTRTVDGQMKVTTQYGHLVVSVVPNQATIILSDADGNEILKGVGSISGNFKVGDYTLTFDYDGFTHDPVKIALASEGINETYTMVQVSKTLTVQIVTNVTGSFTAIYASSGSPVGSVYGSDTVSLKPGDYTYVTSADGYYSERGDFTVYEGMEPVTITLSPYQTVDPDDPGTIVPPGGDDDYVPLPPQIVYEDDGGDDEAVKVAACAAAAVAAAIIALILVAEYRKR